MCANTACNTIKKQSSADNTMRTHQLESDPCVVIKLDIEPLINTPKIVPNGVPTPPLNKVPPMTDAEMASISSPLACSTKPEQLFRQNRNPPHPAKTPFRRYALNFVLRTFNPIIMALCAFPPTAYTSRPNLVYFMMTATIMTISNAIITVG